MNAGAFNASQMNDAAWKLRQFEEPSPSYTHATEVTTRGGLNVRREECFAELIENAVLTSGDTLTNSDPIDPVTAIVSEDYGLLLDGARHESPGITAVAASGCDVVDGWNFWTLVRNGKPVSTLAELRAGQA